MHRILLILLVLANIPDQALAQSGSIRGKVTDPAGPIPYATLLIEGSQHGAISDLNGEFSIDHLPEGTYTLLVSHIAYEKQSARIKVLSDRPVYVEINLISNHSHLEELVFTGTRIDYTESTAPVKVNLISRSLMSATQSNTLSQALNFSPGLRMEVDCQTCNYTQLRMNGLGGAYSQILINNRPLFSSLFGLYGLEILPSSIIDKIEVIKGGGSALYGANAIGGTVNVITRIPEEESLNAELNTSYINAQTSDWIFNTDITRKMGRAAFTILGTGRVRNAYDHNGDEFSEIPKLNSGMAGIRTAFRTGEYSHLQMDLFHIYEYRRGGNHINAPAHETEQAEERTHHVTMGSAEYDISLKEINTHLQFYLGGQYTGRDHYTGIGGVDAYGDTENYSFNTGILANYYLSRMTLTSGFDFQYESVLDRIPYYQYLVDQQTGLFGFFIQTDWLVTDRMNLVLGIRINRHNLLTETVINPRMSFIYNFTENLNLRLSFTNGFRPPQAFDTDLHIAFAGGGISTIFIDPNLNMETSGSGNISLSYDKPTTQYRYGFSVDGFYTRLFDPFILEETDPVNGNMVLMKRNGSDGTVFGLNLELKYKKINLAEASSGFTFQKSFYQIPVNWSSNMEGTRYFLRTPDMYGYYLISLDRIKNFTFSLSGVFTGPMRIPHYAGAPGVNDDKLVTSRPFLENNFKVTLDIPVLKRRYSLEIYTGIQNFSHAYQDDFDTGKNRDSGYIYGPSMPRTFFAGLKIHQ